MLRMFDLHARMGDDSNISRAKLYKRNTTIVYVVVGFNNGMTIMGICPDVETSNQVVKSMTLHNDFITACYYPINFSLIGSIVAITEEIKSRINCTNCGSTTTCDCIVSVGVSVGVDDISEDSTDTDNNTTTDTTDTNTNDTSSYMYGRMERSPLLRRDSSSPQLSIDPPMHICIESNNTITYPNITVTGVDSISDLDILKAIINANNSHVNADDDSDSDNDESIVELVYDN